MTSAKDTEWKNILDAGAMRIISPSEADEIRRKFGHRIVPSRHCYSWKYKDGKRVGKCRWVGRGDKDPDLKELNTYSPMITREAWMASMQANVSHGFTIELGDISSAFMNGLPLERKNGPIYCELPAGGSSPLRWTHPGILYFPKGFADLKEGPR